MIFLLVSFLVLCCLLLSATVYAVNEQSKQWAESDI
ncbi:hypothetical protein UNH65_31045 [Chitinophaga sp. 180180018-2]|nr:hypothetical protein [Chitinophaga sp. 212800010-3]